MPTEPKVPNQPPANQPLNIVKGKPYVHQYPTPDPEHRVIYIRKDSRAAGYKIPEPGAPFEGKGQFEKNLQGFVFATAQAADQGGQYNWFYVNERLNQDAYNFTIDYPYQDKRYPRITRTYVVFRTDKLVVEEPDADTRDPIFDELRLTDHKIERLQDQISDAVFVQVTRTFERLPGPVITSFRDNQFQQTVTVQSQEVTKSVPPLQSALTEGAKQERTGTAKAKNTLESVPEVFPADIFTTEIPSMTRELWLGGFDEESHQQTSAGNAVQPSITAGNYSITEKQLTKFKKEITIRSLPLPQERHHKELTGEFGGGVLAENLYLDTPQSSLDIDQGFLVTESHLRNLEGFGKVKMTKELLELEASSIDVLSPGSGYTGPPSITVTPSAGAVAHAVMGKAVDQVIIDTDGGEYDFPPAVKFIGNCLVPAQGIAFISKGVDQIYLQSPGKHYTSNPTVALTGGGGTGAAATATVGYGVHDIGIVSGGSGYVDPVVVISGDGQGAVAIIKKKDISSTGKIKAITLQQPGSGYTTPPTITIFDNTGPGNSATAVAHLKSQGGVKSITITNPGVDYLYAPTVSLSGGGGVGAKATATIAPAGSVNRVVVTFGGIGYSTPPLIAFEGGSRDLTIPQATAHATLGSTFHVAQIVLDTPGNYTPGSPEPTVNFSGGGGSGASAQYIIGGWPVLYSSVVDPKYGLVTQIIKRVVPAGTTWRPGLGFTEVHSHDKWRSIMITSKADLRSLPAPVVYPTVRHVSLPSTLVSVSPNWSTTIEDNVAGEHEPPQVVSPASVWETDSASADISGSFLVNVQHGYIGPTAAVVTELFFYQPPDLRVLPTPLVIRPAYGTATLQTTNHRHSITTGTRRYGEGNRTTTRSESRTIGPVLTGGFHQVMTQLAKADATGDNGAFAWYGMFADGERTDMAAVQQAIQQATTDLKLGLPPPSGWSGVQIVTNEAPTSVEATAEAHLDISIPLSDPPQMPSGISFLEHMQTDRLGFDVWKVTLVYVYVP